MQDNELKKIRENLRDIIQNKKIEDSVLEGASAEFNQIQAVFQYISKCILDTQGYIASVAKGELDSEPPGKDNFCAGAAKELQSVLKHLTWQTQQVAKGDYRQHIDFLGEFSESFNVMIQQLNERKEKLLENERVMAQTMELMISIMDANNGWVIVTSLDGDEILYRNRELDFGMFGSKGRGCEEKAVLSLLDFAKVQKDKGEISFVYKNDTLQKYYEIKSQAVVWDRENVNAYYVLDITRQELEKKNLSEMAYIDELTKVYNRRYGMDRIQELLNDKVLFSLVMIDLNDLKYVNDTIGHSAGDDYILTCCDVIKEQIRCEDMITRIGGDEFVLILSKCHEDVASNKMLSIANAIENIEKTFDMSISYGIVCTDVREMNLAEMLDVADVKMYDYKNKYKAHKRTKDKGVSK